MQLKVKQQSNEKVQHETGELIPFLLFRNILLSRKLRYCEKVRMTKHNDNMFYGLVIAFVVLLVLLYTCYHERRVTLSLDRDYDDFEEVKNKILNEAHSFFNSSQAHTLVSPPQPGYTAYITDCKPIGNPSAAQRLYACTLVVQDPGNPQPRHMSLIARKDHGGHLYLTSVHGVQVIQQ